MKSIAINNMGKWCCMIGLLFLINQASWAQGKVSFVESSEVKSIMDRFVNYNLANNTIPGWKIQVVSTTDRREMDEARTRFMSLFPGTPVAWKHVAPYYQVRVGAFRSKTELLDQMNEIRKYFAMATPVVDVIEKKDLIKYE